MPHFWSRCKSRSLRLNRLVSADNSLFVIEHNLDVIKTADWIIYMGPEGGDGGGKIVAQGTPEQVACVSVVGDLATGLLTIHGCRCFVGQRLMRTLFIIEGEVVAQSSVYFFRRLVSFRVHVFVLDCSPVVHSRVAGEGRRRSTKMLSRARPLSSMLIGRYKQPAHRENEQAVCILA